MSSTQTPHLVTIDIVSDVVCPWCYLGARRLKHALDMVPELSAQINWRPFQLDPTIPSGGLDRQTYMLKKFGDQARIDAIHERLVTLGDEEGIAFHFERILLVPNTLDAHRLIRWAHSNGTQSAVAERLFSLYFSEGEDIGSPAVLQEVAAQAGLDPEAVSNRLAGDWDKQEVIDEITVAVRLGVTGVPFYMINSRYGIAGAQTAETLAETMQKIASDSLDQEGPADA